MHSVDASRIKECFLNIACEILWKQEHFPGSCDVTVSLKAAHVCMDSERLIQQKAGGYGKDGYMYNLVPPRNPDTGEAMPGSLEAPGPCPPNQ